MSEFPHNLSVIFSKENFGRVLSLIAIICALLTCVLLLDNYFYGFIKSFKIEREIYEFGQLTTIKKNNPFIEDDRELQNVFYNLVKKIDSSNSSGEKQFQLSEYYSKYSANRGYLDELKSCNFSAIQGNDKLLISWSKLGSIFLLWSLLAVTLKLDKKNTGGVVFSCISLGLAMILLAFATPVIINPVADGIIFFTFAPIGLLIIFSQFKKKLIVD